MDSDEVDHDMRDVSNHLRRRLLSKFKDSISRKIFPKFQIMLEKYQSELIEHAMAVGALKFGTFTLKSGRYANFLT